MKLRLVNDEPAEPVSLGGVEINPLVDEFGAYIASLPMKAGVPQAAALDLMEVHALASNVILLDVLSDTTRLRIRFMGTALVSMNGSEATGRYADELALGAHRDAISAAQYSAARSNQPIWSRAVETDCDWHSNFNAHRESMAYERLVWPLASFDGRIVRLAEITVPYRVPVGASDFTMRMLSPADFR